MSEINLSIRICLFLDRGTLEAPLKIQFKSLIFSSSSTQYRIIEVNSKYSKVKILFTSSCFKVLFLIYHVLSSPLQEGKLSST